MSSLELSALAALGTAYLDARHDIVTDIRTISRFAYSVIAWRVALRRGQANSYYIFEKWAKSQPDAPFLIYPEPAGAGNGDSGGQFVLKTYSYGQIYDYVLRYASFLREEMRVHKDDVVAIDFMNRPEYIIVWLALWSLGACPSLINYNLRGAGLIHCAKVSGSKVLLCDEDSAAAGEEVASELGECGINFVLADRQHFERVYTHHSPYRIRDSDRGIAKADGTAAYIFTSGTTGLPKAAIISWEKSWFGGFTYGSVNGFQKSDVMYSAMPLYHSTASILGFSPILQVGAAYAIGHKFSASTFWEQACLCNATLIQYVGETCRYLLSSPPGSYDKAHKVRMALGNGMRPDVWKRFKERFNIPVIAEFYGATELPFILTNKQIGSNGIGACGSYGTLVTTYLQLTKWSIAAIDPDTLDLWRDPVTGLSRRTEPDEPGEFLFKVNASRTHNDFQGYVGNSKATSSKLVFNVFRKGDAWARSGDLLKMDQNHCVYFVDRLGDTFRWKSENVSTTEVEEVFHSIPSVEQCVVVGVQVPRHEGRAGFAIVKPVENAQPDLKEIAQTVSRSLPRYAVPLFLKFSEEIATTGNNKVQKTKFRTQQIPSPTETIYWLVDNNYVPLTTQAWTSIETGKQKL